ncbi:Hpt domain-containing protein [Gemmobacter serpentinus]|uniref:Hpt domain-containing protein n=1 Tax=Gemmobacter serpentinus TaxID=2652247 RepID=UPI00124EFC20|nr:Hpt domain-containing protein [Gemmobacter serpentinus]
MIDWSRVDELCAEVGEEGFDEVVSLFLEETDEAIARIGIDPANLGADLHFLKGGALNLGLSALALSCQDGERHCAEGCGDAFDLAGLRQLYEDSRHALVQGLARRKAA